MIGHRQYGRVAPTTPHVEEVGLIPRCKYIDLSSHRPCFGGDDAISRW